MEKLKNNELEEQLITQERGYINESFSIGADLELWKYWGNNESIYHGAGYWLDIYSQYKLYENLNINLKTIMLNGTISNGYLGFQRTRHVLSIDWDINDKSNLRLLDLERVTVGAGIFVDDSYISGGIYSYQTDYKFYALVSGTSVINKQGDLYSFSLEKEYKYSSLGLSTYTFSKGTDLSDSDKLENNLGVYIKPTQDSDSVHNIEAVINPENSKYAYSIKLGHQFFNKNIQLYAQHRIYDKNVNSYTRFSRYSYIPLELIERDFVNPQNIFYSTGKTKVYSGHLNYSFKLNDLLSLEGSHEYVDLEQPDFKFQKFFYYEKLKYDLGKNKNNSFVYLYLTNKSLNNKSINFNSDIIYTRDNTVGLGFQIFI